MNLSPRNKLIAVAALAAVLIVVLAVALVLPRIRQLGEVRAQVEKAIDDSGAARTLLEQRRQVRNQASVTDAKLIQLAVAVPENPDLPSLIIDLQDTAYDTGVVIMSVTPGEPIFAEGATYVGIPVALEVWGTWSDTVDFMQRLSRTERALRTLAFATAVLPAPTDEAANTAGLTIPPYYQVRSTISLSAYIIPSVDASSSTPAVPVPTE